MRVLEAFNNILIELNKVQAPSLLLDDFIYLFNKGIQEYINERYTLFETKQLLTDDLRVLLKEETLDMSKALPSAGIYGQDYSCTLPNDYMHLLNCVCGFKNNNRCDHRELVYQGANKINANQWPHVVNNYYLKPSAKRPYYYIMNKIDNLLDTKQATKAEKQADAEGGNYERYGNALTPTMRIVYGNDPDKLMSVTIAYLRTPIYYSLSLDQIDAVIDKSQVIEFPDYVIYEVINRIVKLILENGSNPRTQSHVAVNQSIA